MQDIDKLRKSIRDLVNEYGADIVGAILDEADGPWDNEFVERMAFDLKVWRWRRQEAWLATDYISPKVSESFERGLQNWTR